MPKISVIIATYNRCESLKDTLYSLLNQEIDGSFDYEVITADNNSSDKTKEVVESCKKKFKGRLRYLFEPRQGKSYALNRAIKETKGEIIAFTDDDVIARHDWLNNIVKYFNLYSDISGLAGKVLPRINCQKPSWLSLDFNSAYILKGALNCYDHGEHIFYIKNKEKPFLGVNMALRRDIFEKYGLFNEKLKKIRGKFNCESSLGEDTEYYYRIKEGGEKILYAPDVIVEHIFDKSRLNRKYFRYWHYKMGITNVLVNHQNNFKKIFNLPLWLIKELMVDIIQSLKNNFKCNRIAAFYYEAQLCFRLGQVRAYLNLIRYPAFKNNKMPKLAFVNTEWLTVPPIRGGAVENWIECVAQRMNDFSVYIFSMYDKELPLYEKKEHIHYLHFKPGICSRILLSTYKLPFKSGGYLHYLPYSFWCAFTLSRIKPDIIHIHNRPHFVWIIRLLNPRSKIILHIHQVSAIFERNLWNRKLFKNVDSFFGCSQFIADELSRRYPAVKNKVQVIYNGIDTEEFKPVWSQKKIRDEMRNNFGINGQKVILYAGRLAENKGIDILIEAFKEILKYKDKNLRLLICGGRTYSDNSVSPYIEKLHNLSSEIKDNVIFTGYIPHSEIHKYYLMSDLVVIPSLVDEGFCVIAIEGLASGIPVIANAKGGIPEIIKNRQNGVLITNSSKDGLKEEIENFLREESDLYVNYAASGRKTVENYFSWDKVANNLKDTYSRLIKNA